MTGRQSLGCLGTVPGPPVTLLSVFFQLCSVFSDQVVPGLVGFHPEVLSPHMYELVAALSGSRYEDAEIPLVEAIEALDGDEEVGREWLVWFALCNAELERHFEL